MPVLMPRPVVHRRLRVAAGDHVGHQIQDLFTGQAGTILPVVKFEVDRLKLFSVRPDGSTMSRRMSAGLNLSSSFVRSGPISWPAPLTLWQAMQLATVNICLPLANDRPLSAS